jgi:diguanylate cyclase (GGDEF)-like protein
MTDAFEVLELPILLKDRINIVLAESERLLSADLEFSDVNGVHDDVVIALADGLQSAPDPRQGAEPSWSAAVLDLAARSGSVGVVACQLRYLAAGASSLVPLVPLDQRTESTARLHWLVYFGLETVARAAARTLAREAFHSEVTQLRNLRRFEKDMEKRASSGEPFALAYIDMDGLKIINDRDGHEAGDHALRALAGALSDELGDDCTAYHFSGDEFGVAGDDPDLGRLTATLERTYLALEVKFSYGLTIVDPPSGWRDAKNLADAEMQKQKQDRKASGQAPPRPY